MTAARKQTARRPAPRRANGDAKVYQRASDGRWVGVVNLGWKDGKRVRKTVYGATREEAKQKRDRVVRDVTAGLPVPDDQITVAAHLSRWFSVTLPDRVSANTLANYKTIADTHILPTLGRKRLAKLTPMDVEVLLRAKLEEGKSPSTVRRIRAVLVQSLKQAERWGLVARNVAALTDGPRVGRAVGRSLTVEQARAFLDAAAGGRLEAAHVLMLALGLRRGEVLGLPWAAVDFDKQTVTIRQALPAPAAGQRLTISKVKAESERTLHLPAPVANLLRDRRKAQRVEQLAAADWDNPHGLVFTTPRGTPIDPNNYRHTFDRIARRAGLEGWHPHELRHSAASLLLAQGVALEVVSEVLGHHSIRMTKDVYGHLIGTQKAEAAHAMTGALWGT